MLFRSSIYLSQLKITDIVTDVPGNDYQMISYESPFISITYYVKTEIDKDALMQEKEKLEASIARRQQLLSNENYTQKAPQHIVELDRVKLKEEEERLASIQQQLSL